MAEAFDSITDEQAELIKNAHVFFVATADSALAGGPGNVGAVNVSPKGGVPLHVLDRNRVAYLDYEGSGNETARHSSAGGPITVMVCAFEQENAATVRLYGHARVTQLEESPLAELVGQASAAEIGLVKRQVIDVHVDSTITSCGYGVPILSYAQDRTPANRGRKYKPKRAVQA